MNTARTSPGEFRTSHDATTARLLFMPYGAELKDITIPSLTAADLRAIAAMASSQADDMEPAPATEPVQVRLTGTPHAVAALAGLLTAQLGRQVSQMVVKNRTEHLAQGYLTMFVPEGNTQ
jgi:hypothetical protein